MFRRKQLDQMEPLFSIEEIAAKNIAMEDRSPEELAEAGNL